jgi:hypothetical protein
MRLVMGARQRLLEGTLKLVVFFAMDSYFKSFARYIFQRATAGSI